MTQIECKNDVLRHYYAQQAAVQVVQAEEKAAQAQIEQLSRKLTAARTEIRRYQTRMFAFERQVIALRRENMELETSLEQVQDELQLVRLRAEQAENALAELSAMLEQSAQTPVLPEAEPVQQIEPEQLCPCDIEATPVQEPLWQPKTAAEQLAVWLIDWFDAMMP